MLVKKGTKKGIAVRSITINGEPFPLRRVEYCKTGPKGWIQALVLETTNGSGFRVVLRDDKFEANGSRCVARETFKGNVQVQF